MIGYKASLGYLLPKMPRTRSQKPFLGSSFGGSGRGAFLSEMLRGLRAVFAAASAGFSA